MAPLQMGLFGKTQAEVDQMEEEMKGMSEVCPAHCVATRFHGPAVRQQWPHHQQHYTMHTLKSA